MADLSSLSAEELQRQIEIIQQQIAEQEEQQKHSNPPISNHHDVSEHLEDDDDDEYEEQVIEEDEDPGSHRPADSVSDAKKLMPTWKQKQLEKEEAKRAAKAREDEDRQARAAAAVVVAAASVPHGHDEYAHQTELLKQRHGWEKPAWAAPLDDIPPDAAILSDPIENPMLKPVQHGGYQRQVKEKDLEIIKGTFVKPETTKKLEPRLTWIVVNMNKRKVGKIVMHLYGQHVHDIVDHFVELKGLAMERHNGVLQIVGVEPAFYVLPTSSVKGLDSKGGVYGVIQEGRDIFETIMSAAPDAILSVKQAHIYPVKKGSSGL